MDLILTIAAFLIIPIGTMIGWYLSYVKKLPEREKALTRGSHGALLLSAAGALIYATGWREIVAGFRTPVVPFVISVLTLVIGVWGGAWFIYGMGWRSRGLRDGWTIWWCVLTLGVAGLFWCASRFAPGHMKIILLVIAAAFFVPSFVKLVLVMRHPRGWNKADDQEQHAYGQASFAPVDEAVRDMRRR